MARPDATKQKLREAEAMLAAAQSQAERQRWTEIVQGLREMIKQSGRLHTHPK